ncbi:MAG: GNAT family N-acetyltransferase [Oscillospiraceae bacterium]
MFTFETITHAHLTQLANLYVRAFNAPPWNDDWTAGSAVGRLSLMLRAEGSFGIVMRDEEDICGMMLGGREFYYDCLHFQIKELFTDPRVQGTGAGTALLEESERRLRDIGIRKVYLFTVRNEMTEGFYHKRGYDARENMVVMSKRLIESKTDQPEDSAC